MQNKLYTTQFSHHPMTDLQPVPEQRSQNPELTDFAKLLKTDRTPGEVHTPGQERIRTHRKEKGEKK